MNVGVSLIMKNLLKKIPISAKKQVVVIGDVMLDEYVFGDVSRISPEAPVPVLRVTKKEWSLGGAANVANNIASSPIFPLSNHPPKITIFI